MRRSLTGALMAGVLVALMGCYHATIETGAPPSPQTIDEGWASGWVFGLVPPKAVEAASRCPDGVAKVETQLSFLNQLVGFLTFGIYTPMSIKVTCAAAGTASTGADAGTEIVVSGGPMADALGHGMTAAVHRSLVIGAPVVLRQGSPE